MRLYAYSTQHQALARIQANAQTPVHSRHILARVGEGLLAGSARPPAVRIETPASCERSIDLPVSKCNSRNADSTLKASPTQATGG